MLLQVHPGHLSMISVMKGSTQSLQLDEEPSQAVHSLLQEEQEFKSFCEKVPLGHFSKHVVPYRYLSVWHVEH